jgi:hypothetical protein
MVFQADGEILCHVPLAIDDEDSVPKVEELADEPLNRIELPGILTVPPLHFSLKEETFVFIRLGR